MLLSTSTLERFSDQYGNKLSDICLDGKVVLVFLRHLSCIFCREALFDISKESDHETSKIVVVHMGPEEQAKRLLSSFGLENQSRIEDPTRELYRYFKLEETSFKNLLSLKVLRRFVDAYFKKGLRQKGVNRNPFQLGGAFVIENGKVISEFRQSHVGDSPPAYCSLTGPSAIKAQNKVIPTA